MGPIDIGLIFLSVIAGHGKGFKMGLTAKLH